MTKRNKKGFTIVELVIVIAIVAILAAVLIPTFSSIIERANDSSDIQTVRQLNTAVSAEAAEKGRPLTYEELYAILSEYGFDLENLTPAGKDNEFLWHTGNNIFILVDSADGGLELIYPDEDSEDVDISNPEVLDTIQEIISAAGGNKIEITEGTNLKEALETGGNFYLSDPVTLAEAITINNDVTIDLNGETLTIGDPVDEYWSVYLTGSLTIKNSDENNGSVIVKETSYESNAMYGIYVEGPDEEAETLGGTLNLENVNIEGNRENIICNYGTVSITNSVFNVNDGFGIDNWGTVFITNSNFIVNCGLYYYGLANYGGSVTITGGSVTTSVGNADYAIQSPGGTTTINGTTFSGQYSVSTIFCTGGTLNLCGVTTTQCENNCDVKASGSCVVNIDDPEGKTTPPCSTFKNPMELGGTSTIYNGIYEGLITYKGEDDNPNLSCTIKNGLFNGGFTLTSSGNVYIEDGIFTGTVSAIDAGSNSWDEDGCNKGLVINGGTFTVDEDETIVYCDEQSEIYINGGSFTGKLECVHTNSFIYISSVAGENLKFTFPSEYTGISKEAIEKIVTTGNVSLDEDNNRYKIVGTQ